MFYEASRQMMKQLGQLDRWLELATTFAADKNFDASAFLGLRLAPDQFTFARQVQAVCDVAKLATSRLTGKEAPEQADTEQSIAELRARVKSVIDYIGSVSAKDFEGAAERVVTQPRWEGKFMNGADYFMEHALPNFYFHLTTAYALLRHAGVRIGKRDFLGPLSLRTQ